MKITKRLVGNQEILKHLEKIFETHPDLRFTQILEIIYDPTKYYEEPEETLDRIKEILG